MSVPYGVIRGQAAYRTIREYRDKLTRQQVKTLVGQIKAGQADAAMNGLAKILDRRGGGRG